VAGLSLASPGFVCFILTKVSGIPLTEKSYDAKYGHREDYQAWKQSTPRLLPRLF
jgi:steroid 5-alpha reductase family enzyme